MHRQELSFFRNSRRGNTRFQIIASCILFFSTIGLVILLVSFRRPAPKKPDDRKSPLVDVVKISQFSKPIVLHLSGFAVPFREINVTAQVAGSITGKSDQCRAGIYVEGDYPLISIDSKKYKLTHSRLKQEKLEIVARQGQLKKQIQHEKEQLVVLERDLIHKRKILKETERLLETRDASQSEFIANSGAVNSAENLVIQQKIKIESLETDQELQKIAVEKKDLEIEQADIDVKNAEIKAPASGVIISENVQKDGYVQIGTPLFVFEDTSMIEVRCDLRPDQLEAVLATAKPENRSNNRFALPPVKATITYRGFDGEFKWIGKLSRYDGLGLDEKTRTAPCRIEVSNTRSECNSRTLMRGMFVRVELELESQPNLVAIPSEAVRAGNYIWVNDNTRLRKHQLKIMHRMLDKKDSEFAIVETTPGKLEAGTEVVLSPIPLPTDGMELRIQNVSEIQPYLPDDPSSNDSGDPKVRPTPGKSEQATPGTDNSKVPADSIPRKPGEAKQ